MKRLVSVFVFSVLAALPVRAEDASCEGPEHSTRAEACKLARQNEGLSAEMDKVLAQVQRVYSNRGGVEESRLLAAAQQAWASYRDSSCAYEQSVNGGMHGISWHRCNAQLLGERIDYLREQLGKGDYSLGQTKD